MILQQIQCPLKANYPIIFFRAHSYIVGKYSLELPISQTSTFSKGIHVYLRLIDYLTDSVMRSLVVTICIDQPLYEKRSINRMQVSTAGSAEIFRFR